MSKETIMVKPTYIRKDLEKAKTGIYFNYKKKNDTGDILEEHTFFFDYETSVKMMSLWEQAIQGIEDIVDRCKEEDMNIMEASMEYNEDKDFTIRIGDLNLD